MVVWIAANTPVFCFLSPERATSRVQIDMTPAGGRPGCGCDGGAGAGDCDCDCGNGGGDGCDCGGGRDADAVSGKYWERVRSGGDNSGGLSPGSDVGEIRPLLLLFPPLLGGLLSLNNEEELKSSLLFHEGWMDGQEAVARLRYVMKYTKMS